MVPEKLCAVLDAGVDLVRINFSHGNEASHRDLFALSRECAKRCGKEIGIIADLQGPKIRVGRFKEGQVELVEGQTFTLDATLGDDQGDAHCVGIDYKGLPKDVGPGDLLLLNDGLIELIVTSVNKDKVETQVLCGGLLSNNKGINRRGGGLSANALTEKDKADMRLACQWGADYIAISFPRNADDIKEARRLILNQSQNIGLIAKIERKEAVDAIDEIIIESDAVMVARGDLGVEIGPAQVPGVQKKIINRARALDKAVITATQMMESMIHQAIPTRAEVSDVANAVLDGTDAVMLSAETATGAYPLRVIEVMNRVCLSAEREPDAHVSGHRLECTFERIDEAIAMATMYTANHLPIDAIITLTESGATPLWMSRIRSGIPIYALTRHVITQRKMTLYRGVSPLHFDPTLIDRREVNQKAVELVASLGLVDKGAHVILTKGNYMGTMGGTNAMKLLQVGNVD